MSFFLLMLTFSLNVQAKKVLVLNDPGTTYSLDSSYFEKINLNDGSFGNAEVLSNNRLYFHNPDVTKDYWYRINVTNRNNQTIDWLLVSYFYTIDEIDFIITDGQGRPKRQIFRDTMSIYSREIRHKQPTFSFSILPGETKTLYIKIKNESTYEYSFGIFSHFHYFSTYFLEYLLIGLFYGLMLFALIYSTINYIFFKDKVVLIYIAFILSQITHMLFRDGNGLYILPQFAASADLIKNLSRAAMSVTILLYTLSFLKIQSASKTFILVMLYILARIIFALIMMEETSVITFHFELGAIMISTFLSIQALLRKDNDAKYMVVGFSALCISYFIFYLSVVWFSALGPTGYFIMYYGIATESIFTTLALTERFKRIRVDNFKKDQMNKELEKIVAERTELITIQNKTLEEQADELNLFLYSASHDLKGPLKSIEGLVNLGMKDPDVNHEQIYSLIREKLAVMEGNISDLNSVTLIKNKEKESQPVDFRKIHREVLEKFHKEISPGIITISFNMENIPTFSSDQYTIRMIYGQIIENAIKFRDTTKKPLLNITIREKAKQLILSFEDNGVGIEQNKIASVFNMFYRGNEKSANDTGLGLYIVKIAVKKLSGTVDLVSTPGQGSTFTITLPY